jgi:hypothetical protein
MSVTRPPLGYLVTCSQMALESVELSRLNRASNLRKEFHQILEEWIDSEVDARLARSILEWKRDQDLDPRTCAPDARGAPHFQQLSIAFLPESRAANAQATEGCDPGLRRTDERRSAVAPAECAQSPAKRRKPDPAIAPRRSLQLARSAETRLREVEDFAECFPRRLRGCQRKSATKRPGLVSCAEPATRPRDRGGFVVRPSTERVAGTIEFVPLQAGRDQAEAPAQIGSGVCRSGPVRDSSATLHELARHWSLGTPSRCTLPLQLISQRAHLRERPAV